MSVHDKPTPSKVSILKHPLHPMVVVFPVAFLLSVVITDGVFWWRADAFWAEVSFWLLASGISVGALAALLGFVDFLLIREVRRYVTGWSHFIAGIMVLALAAANLGLRWADPEQSVLPWGIVLSSVMALMVSITGWLGGTLTFRYGIGTYHDERGGHRDLGAFDE